MKHPKSSPLIPALTALTGAVAAGVALQAADEKPPGWETTAAAGATLTRGNSKNVLFTANVLTQRKWARDEVRFGVDGAYGEANGLKNSDLVHGFGQYNRLFTERLYGYLRADAVHDEIADVAYRIALSPGAGYYFIKNERTTLSAEVGPGVVFEKQGGIEQTYLTLRVAERFEHKLSKTARIWQSVEWLPQVDHFKNYLLNAEIGVEAKLTEKASLRVFVQDTYDNEPAPGRLKNDVKLVAQIGYTF